MQSNERFRGLCLTCNNNASCMYSLSRTKPIFDCNEYNGEGGSAGEVISTQPIDITFSMDQPLNEQLREFDGICPTCQQREKCSLSHTPGGVWHCEEYA